VRAYDRSRVVVEINRPDIDSILSGISVQEVVNHYDHAELCAKIGVGDCVDSFTVDAVAKVMNTEDILDSIGRDEVLRYFGVVE
jgi:glutaminase